MLLEDQLQIYPPRVIMEVILKTNEPLTIVMKFSGSLDDSRLDVELAFPLGRKVTVSYIFLHVASSCTAEHILDEYILPFVTISSCRI